MPADASKILQDRIRATFLELLPEEKLDELVKTEWDRFFTDSGEGYYPSQRKFPSPFKMMVRTELNKFFSERLEEWIRVAQQGLWRCTEDGASAAFDKVRLDRNEFFAGVVKEVAPSVLDDLVGNIVKHTIETMQARKSY
jgi:hypothetical protein